MIISALSVLRSASDVCRRIAEVAAAAILVVIFVINGLEICARSTYFNHSFDWIYEVNLLLGAWLYFLGIVPVYYRGGDVTLRGYETVLTGRAREIYRAILELVTATAFGVLAWFAWILIELQLPFRTPGMRIPNALFTAPVFLGLCAIALTGVRRALDLWYGRPVPTQGGGH